MDYERLPKQERMLVDKGYVRAERRSVKGRSYRAAHVSWKTARTTQYRAK